MNRMRLLGQFASLALLPWLSHASPADPRTSFEFNCAALPSRLNDRNAPETTIFQSQYLSAGSVLDLKGEVNTTCVEQFQLTLQRKIPADVCRVTAYAKTSERSGINFELWMPRSWSGRLMSHGGGGLSGCIDYDSLERSSSEEFATIITNGGHNGSSGGAFFHNPEVVKDFVSRSIHTGAVLSKSITRKFYGKRHTKSYYLGCSTGGRQGFKSVQEHPDDFDGVVAGCPAIAFNNLTAWWGSVMLRTNPPGASDLIPAQTWTSLIHADILKQCDRLDGVEDGVVQNPSLCRYDPKRLECDPSQSSANTTCLTKAQIEYVKAAFSPLTQVDGSLIYPGVSIDAAYVPQPGGIDISATDWFRYVVYQNPSWDLKSLSLADMKYASKLNPSNAETWNGDLSAFRNRGSKVLHWHGVADQVIPSQISERYYEHVRSTMGLTYSAQDEFYRFFPVTGTGHCVFGNGAWAVGQISTAVSDKEPDRNVLSAIVRWVEQDIAPNALVGTKWVNDTKTSGVAFQRTHCKYPAVSTYKGQGDSTSLENWACIDPRK